MKKFSVNENKGKRIFTTGILRCNVISIDDCVIEWLDGQDFDMATLAKGLGIDIDHQVKAKITIEIAEEPCAVCGQATSGDKLCCSCSRLICDECAKIRETDRYCPTCSKL